MTPRSRRRPLQLVILPLLLALALWPVARHQQQRARQQAATRALKVELARWPQSKALELIRNCMADGADANLRLDSTNLLLTEATPLHIVAASADGGDDNWGGEDISCEMARLLISHDANVNARDKDGETPLMLAASTFNSDLVRLLLQHGAQANALTPRTHQNALDYLQQSFQNNNQFMVSETDTPDQKRFCAQYTRKTRLVRALLQTAGKRPSGNTRSPGSTRSHAPHTAA